MSNSKTAVVAGSLGLDIIPVFAEGIEKKATEIFAQGQFNDMNGTRLYLGGCVGNTGIAMHKLGVPVTLVSKVGDDLLGSVVEMILKRQNVSIKIEKVKDSNTTSTTIIAPFGGDRILLHSRGASQTFVGDDIDLDLLKQTDLIHFGYPTAMKYLYANEGAEFIKLVDRAKSTGITVSVDTSQLDSQSEAGKVNWPEVLKRSLPFVDIFMPSVEELIYMLRKPLYQELDRKRGMGNMIDYIDFSILPDLGNQLLEMGVKIVCIKLGKKGLYLLTGNGGQVKNMGRALPDTSGKWISRELIHPPYFTDKIRSTTGAGDNAIAGFLASFLKSDKPERALAIASINALRCIESYETTAAVVPIEKLYETIAGKPKQEPLTDIPFDYWKEEAEQGIFYGRLDSSRK